MSSVGVQCLHLYEKSGTDLFQQESSVSISGGIEIVCTLFNLLQGTIRIRPPIPSYQI